MKTAKPIEANMLSPPGVVRTYQFSAPWNNHDYGILAAVPLIGALVMIPMHKVDPIKYLRWRSRIKTRLLRAIGRKGPLDSLPFLVPCPSPLSVFITGANEEQALARIGYTLEGEPLQGDGAPKTQTLDEFLEQIIGEWKTPPSDPN